jgi:DNA-binding transcriptional MerR regulator
MTTDAVYTIGDLARLSGVAVRTVRYYISQGLLPAAGEPGPGAHYGEGHLNRLRLTKRLQEQHLPLAEIRTRLAGLSDAEIASLVESAQRAEPAPASALEYIASILEPRASETSARYSRVASTPLAAPASAGAFARETSPSSTSTGSAEPLAQPLERSQWERLSLGPNLELHIRRPLSRVEQKRVERLITIARQVLKEDTP